MTKRECIDFCVLIIKRVWAKPSLTCTFESQSAFDECKYFCARQGYFGQSFYDIWSKAVDKYECELGVRPIAPVYTIR